MYINYALFVNMRIMNTYYIIIVLENVITYTVVLKINLSMYKTSQKI